MTFRKIAAALAVVAWVALVWWFIAWRTAPPPPPKVAMPGEALPAATAR